MVPLSEIMATELVTVSPDLTLQDVARVFAEAGISGAPVVSGRELVGGGLHGRDAGLRNG